jgi:hypothetical protein
VPPWITTLSAAMLGRGSRNVHQRVHLLLTRLWQQRSKIFAFGQSWLDRWNELANVPSRGLTAPIGLPYDWSIGISTGRVPSHRSCAAMPPVSWLLATNTTGVSANYNSPERCGGQPEFTIKTRRPVPDYPSPDYPNGFKRSSTCSITTNQFSVFIRYCSSDDTIQPHALHE